jgi:proline iminopeptidase
MTQKLRVLYPEIEPYMEGKLRVSELHKIAFEECGNPDGIPVIVLHGGPGAGMYPQLRRFFDPVAYRIIIFSQRGCGGSEPHCELRENTTKQLVGDIEKIRMHLGIRSWVVFGGSWGSTLALAYGQAHPHRVRAYVLRGIFLGSRAETRWFLEEGGASSIWPDEWERFMEPVRTNAKKSGLLHPLPAYYQMLMGSDYGVRERAARAWARWESVCSKLIPEFDTLADDTAPCMSVPLTMIECFYYSHAFFMEEEQLIQPKNIRPIAATPATIVQGRYDMVCPPLYAWKLHRAWPEAELIWSNAAGHAAGEAETTHHLVTTTDKYRDYFSEFPV